MSYAARHPDLFAAALSFSGAPDLACDALAQTLVTPVIDLTAMALDGAPIDAMFGSRLTDEINWAAHDPATLAPNLQGMRRFLYSGNGQPGPLDTGLDPGASAIEGGVSELTQLFHQRLQSLGIPSFYEPYGPGTHSWPDWARDLRESIGKLMDLFEHPPPAPSSIGYTSAAASCSVFGWQVTMARKVQEFSTLSAAGRDGFIIRGSGSAVVRTPGRYRRGAPFVIRVVSASGLFAPFSRAARVGRDHRLTVTVPLGRPTPFRTTRWMDRPFGTTTYSTRVSLTRGLG